MAEKGTLTRPMLERIPEYLKYLRTAETENVRSVSATTVSRALGLGEVMVRKDLGSVSGEGRPKTGYDTSALISRLEGILDFGGAASAVVIGAGKLGYALCGYRGFAEYGISITAAFDTDSGKTLNPASPCPVYPLSELKSYCLFHNVGIAIITVPADSAQAVCDIAVAGGVRAIWNFAPVKLTLPETVPVKNENLASSLALLAAQALPRR